MKSSAQSSEPRNSRSNSLPRALLFICALLAAGTAAFLINVRGSAYKVPLTRGDGPGSFLDVGALRGKLFLNLKTGRMESLGFASPNTLLVFMAAGDCPSGHEERRAWGEIARSLDESRLQVIGILIRSSQNDARTLMSAYDLPFTCYLDVDDQVKQDTTPPPQTPFKVLFNRRGDVLLVGGPTTDSSKQGELVGKVLARLEAARAAE